jgi:hypothetical protein
MHHAAAEALASLSTCREKSLRSRITCSPRPRNPVRGLRLPRPLRPDVLCREDAQALSPPQQSVSAGQRAHLSSRRFSSRITGYKSRVTGRRSRAAGCPSPHSQLSMLAPTSRLSTLELSTLELSTIDCQLLWRLISSLSPLEYALTQKRVCKSFGMHTYKSLDLKSPGMNTYKKHPGGGVPPRVEKGRKI